VIRAWWVLLALAALALLAAAVALIPLVLTVGAWADAGARRWRAHVRLSTAWGWPRRSLAAGGRAATLGRRRGGDAGEASRQDPGGPGDGRDEARVQATVARLWRCVQVPRARICARLGLGDAARTALACGSLYAAAGAGLAALPGAQPAGLRIVVRPAFSTYEGRVRVALSARLRLWQAAWVVAAVLRR